MENRACALVEQINAKNIINPASKQVVGLIIASISPRINGTRFFNLLHKIAIPLPLYFDMSGRAKQNRLYQIVIQIHVLAGLRKLIKSGHGRAPGDEPCLKICRGLVREGTSHPHEVGVATDQVRAGVSVRLGVNQ
jgi:hypothetical protein